MDYLKAIKTDFSASTEVMSRFGIKAKCNKCGKNFDPKDILLVQKPKSFFDFAGLRQLVGIRHKNKYYVPVSPCCKEEHPHGFDTTYTVKK